VTTVAQWSDVIQSSVQLFQQNGQATQKQQGMRDENQDEEETEARAVTT
jgi:hypothetical protein